MQYCRNLQSSLWVSTVIDRKPNWYLVGVFFLFKGTLIWINLWIFSTNQFIFGTFWHFLDQKKVFQLILAIFTVFYAFYTHFGPYYEKKHFDLQLL